MSPQSENNRLSEFFRTEYRKLLGYVHRRIDFMASQDAEDFVHDVAVNLIDRADIGLPIEHLSAYVYQALRNRIVDYFRRRRRMEPLVSDEAESPAASPDAPIGFLGHSPDKHIRRVESAHDLTRLMTGLNEEERRLIFATEIEGRTFRDLSETWGVSEGTLLSRKSRALTKIRKQLEELTLKE